MSTHPDTSSDATTDPIPGRLFVVAGAPGTEPATVARAIAADRERGVAVDGALLAGCVVAGATSVGGAGQGVAASAGLAVIEDALLRYVAMLALADVFTRAGFDVVLAEVMGSERLDDLLDLVDPEPVTVIRLQGDAGPDIVGPGVSVDGTGDPAAVAGAALAAADG